jgi:hypothetical protein
MKRDRKFQHMNVSFELKTHGVKEGSDSVPASPDSEMQLISTFFLNSKTIIWGLEMIVNGCPIHLKILE